MAALDSFLPVVAPQSDTSIGKIDAPSAPNVQTSFDGPSDPKPFTLDDWAKQPSSLAAKLAPDTFDYDKENADEFVGTKNYKSIGYDPRLGHDVNELRYHQAQTTWDAVGDTLYGLGSKAVHGFADLLTGWKNTASLLPGMGPVFKQNELEEIQKKQQDQENQYHIYTDPTNSNWLSWDALGKGIQETGGIVGAGAEIVAEQLAIAAISAATFGTAAPELEATSLAKDAMSIGDIAGQTAKVVNTLDKTAAIRQTYEAYKESKSFKDALNFAKAKVGYGIGEAADALGGVAKSVLPVGGNLLGFATDTYDAVKAKQAGSVLSTIGKGFGAFYNDVRDLNLAISMGKGSAVGTYSQQVQEQSDSYRKEHGSDPLGIDLQQIKDNAYEAATKDGAIGSFVALYTNKLAFGNLLKGDKIMKEALLTNVPGEFSNLVRGTTEKEFAENGERLAIKEDTWDTFRNRAMRKLAGFKDPEMYKSMLLHGAGFGVTMSGLATVDDAIQSYYSAKYGHKEVSVGDAISNAVDKQFTKQGAHTFISAFLTGAVVSPLMEAGGEAISRQAQRKAANLTPPVLPDKPTPEQKQVYDRAKTIYQQRVEPKLPKAATPEQVTDFNQHKAEYDNYQKTQQTAAKKYVDAINEQWKNPLGNYMSDVILQSNWAGGIENGLKEDNNKTTQDNRSDAGINFLISAAKNNMIEPYLENLDNKIHNLSPEELHDAIYADIPNKPQFSEQSYSELKQKISDFETNARQIKDIYKDMLRAFPYPANPNLYKIGTAEEKAATQLNEEHSEAIGFAAFYKSSVIDKLYRQNKILNGDSISGGLYSKLQDVTFYTAKTLASVPGMDDELSLLKTLKGSESIFGNRKEAASAKHTEEQVNLLKKYREAVNGYNDKYNNALKINDQVERKTVLEALEGEYKNPMKSLLTKLFNNHLLQEGIDGSDFHEELDKQALDDITKSYMDYYKLGVEHNNMIDTLNTILDPRAREKYLRAFHKSINDAKTTEAYKAEIESKPVTKPKPTTEPVETIPFKEAPKPAPETVTPEPVVNEPPKPIVDEKAIHKELLDHFIYTPHATDVTDGEEYADTSVLSQEATEYLKDYPDLKAKINAVTATSQGAEETNKAVKEIIDDQFSHIQSLQSFPNLKGEPHVSEYKAGDYRIDAIDKFKSYPTPGEANRALQKWIDENHPTVKVNAKEYRQNQYLWDDERNRKLFTYSKGKSYVGGQSVSVKELEGYHTTKPESAPEEVKPVEVTPETPKEYKKATDKIHNQIAIYPYRKPGETDEIARQRITNIIRTTPNLKDGISLTISKGPRAGETIKFDDNPYIVQNREAWSLQLNFNGEPLSFISSPNMYSWNDDNGNPVDTQNLTVDLFKKGVDVKGQDASVALQQWKDDDLRAKTLANRIKEVLGNKPTATLSGKDLDKVLTVVRMSGGYEFMNNPNPDASDAKAKRPTLADYLKDGHELLKIINVKTGETTFGDKDAPEPKWIYTGIGTNAAILRLKNGSLAAIELQDPRFESPEQLGGFVKQLSGDFQGLKELYNKSGRTGEFIKAKKDFNKLCDTIFYALDPHLGRPLLGLQAAESKGRIVLQAEIMFKDGAPVDKMPKSKLLTIESLTGGKDWTPEQIASDVMKQVNDWIRKYDKSLGINLTPDNFRKSDVPVEQKQGGVSRDINRPYLTYEPNSSPIVAKSELVVQSQSAPKPAMSLETQVEKKEISKDILDQLAANNFDSAFDDLEGEYLKTIDHNDFSDQDITNLEEFKNRIANNYPAFLSVGELDSVFQRLGEQHVTVGRFVTYLNRLGGQIQVNENSPYKYHEELHAVFNLLLDTDKRKELLKLAEKANPVTEKKLEDFRKKGYVFDNPETEKERFQEEYIADKFEDWKKNHKTPLNGTIRGFFEKLWNWIKELWNRFTGNDIEALFYKMDRAGFKNAKLQTGDFTETSISEPAAKIIEFKTKDKAGNEVNRSLGQQESNQLSSAISALYIEAVNGEPYKKPSEILDNILDKYRGMLNPRQEKYYDRLAEITNLAEREDFARRLMLKWKLFSDPEARESLKDAVADNLRIWGYRQNLEDDYVEEIASIDNGEPQVYDAAPDSYGGFANLSKGTKLFIGSTTFDYVDEFGNRELEDGVPLKQSVNSGYVYNGLLQMLASSTSDQMIIDKLEAYKKANTNPDTCAFIDKLFLETGFNKDESGQWVVTKNQGLFRQVINDFRQFPTNALFAEVSPGTGGTSRVFSANREGAAKTQFDQNAQSHNAVFLSGQNNLNKSQKADYAKPILQQTLYPIKEMFANKEVRGKQISDDKLRDFSQDIANKLKDKLGLSLNPMLITCSVAAGKDLNARTEEQKQLVAAFGENKNLIDVESIDGVKTSLLKGENIFSQGEEGKGAANHLMSWFTGNAKFDQSVWSMSYIDAEGKRRFGYQLPTYNMESIQKMNAEDGVSEFLQDAIEDIDKQGSHLLYSNEFHTMSAQGLLKVENVDGLKQVYHSFVKDGDNEGDIFVSKNFEVNREKGASFKSMGQREDNVFTLTAYGSAEKVQYGPDKSDSFYTAPVSLGVIGESNTRNLVRLPIIHAVDIDKKGESRMSQIAVDIVYDKVMEEFNRIKRVKEEIETLSPEQKIQDYHNGKERGLKLFYTKDILGKLADVLENGANGLDTDGNKLEKDYVPSKVMIDTQVRKHFRTTVSDYIDYLNDLGLIGKTEKGITNKLLPGFIEKGLDDSAKNDGLNLVKGNFKHNLAQIYINNYLNSIGIRQLLHGDDTKAYKSWTDITRRNKIDNASGKSIAFPESAPELGIHHGLSKFHHVLIPEPTFLTLTGEKKELADAQGYMTTNGLRYMLYGFGKLSKTQADIINEIDRGSKGAEGMFIKADGLRQKIDAFPAYKTVYGDGQTNLKWAVITLTKELTSIKQNGKWIPRINCEELHHLRESLEAQEERSGTIAFASPASASKGLKFTESPGVRNIHADYFHELDANCMRLQTELPSNKLTITDPTGIKFNILTEQDPEALTADGRKVGDVMEEYKNLTALRIENNNYNIVNSIFSRKDGKPIALGDTIHPDEVAADLGKLYDQIKDTHKATGTDSQTLEFMSTRDGQPIYDLNMPSTLQKFTQSYLSFIGKPLKEKVPGMKLTMVSPYGKYVIREVHELNEEGQPKRWTIHTDSMYEKNPSQYSNVIRHSDSSNETYSGLAEAMSNGPVYVLDTMNDVYPEYDETGKLLGYFSECQIPAHFSEEQGGKILEALQYMMATRIPYDDKHQTVVLKKIDTLPAYYGSVVMTAAGVYTRGGSDNDADALYALIMDTYKKGKQRLAYGSATTPKTAFDEYIGWNLKNNKLFRDKVKELKGLYNKKNDTINNIDSDEIADTEDLEELFKMSSDDLVYKTALKELKLPSDAMEYSMAGGAEKLNNGYITNQILKNSISLLSSEHISGEGKDAIINQATDTSPIKALVDPENPNSIISILHEKGLSNDAPVMKQLLGKYNYDTNTIDGAARMRQSAKEGKDDIAGVINSLMATGLLQQFDIHGIPIHFGSKSYSSFGETTTEDGTRKLTSLSALANSSTDNLKDGDTISKLGLNIEAMGIAATLVGKGMNLKSVIWILQQPSVREYFSKISTLNGILKTPEERNQSKKGVLEKLIRQYTTDVPETEIDNDKLIDAIVDNGKDKAIQLAALQIIDTMSKEADIISNMNKVMQLMKGYPASWEDVDKVDNALNNLGIVYEEGKYVEKENFDTLMDVRKVFTEHSIYTSYLKKLAQDRELSKKVFLERTDVFSQMSDIINANFNVRGPQTEEFNKTFKHDAISYLGILRLLKKMQDRGESIADFNHGLIYDASQKPGQENIKDVIDRLRKFRGKNQNFLVNKFLRLVLPGDVSNRDNMYKAVSNTWAKLSEQQMQKLQDSFTELFNNPTTKKDATTLFHYLLVKDGAQFKSQSFISILPPFIFKDFSDSIHEVNQYLASEDYSPERAMDVLGKTHEQWLNDLMTSYTTHVKNKFFLRDIEPKISSYVPEEINKKGEKIDVEAVKRFTSRPVKVEGNGTLNISIFNGIRDKNYVEIGRGIVVQKEGNFDATERAMVAKNIDSVRKSGFNSTKTKEGTQIEFPWTINRVIRGEIGQSDMRVMYELVSVGKEKVKGNPTNLIENGENIPKGISATYKLVQGGGIGSKGQWAGAGVFGKIPDVESIKRAIIAKGEQSITNPPYSPSSPDKQEIKDTTTPKSDVSGPIAKDAQEGIYTVGNKRGIKTVNDKGEVVPSLSDLAERLARGSESVPDDISPDEFDEEPAPKQIDWKREIESAWRERNLPDSEKEEWLTKARDVYKSLVGKVSDSTILDKIKNCI